MSNIEWTDCTWNPVVGCTPVSPGCLNCYAAGMARRLEAMGKPEYLPAMVDRKTGARAEGSVAPLVNGEYRAVRIAEVKAGRAVFTGDVRTVPDRLMAPLHWRKSRMVFVNSMSDLFHEDVPFEFIDKVFAVMALCPQHTFQVLTKRPERMAEFLARRADIGGEEWTAVDYIAEAAFDKAFEAHWPDPAVWWVRSIRGGAPGYLLSEQHGCPGWPLPNVWLGTSVENQKCADERIPHLLRCPAAVRFLSCEPLLGPLNLTTIRDPETFPGCMYTNALTGDEIHEDDDNAVIKGRGVDWVIVGGESGPKSRPCDVAWIKGVVDQCGAVGVPVFVKQLGANVQCRNDKVSEWLDEVGMGVDYVVSSRVHMQGDPVRVMLNDRKGGDPAEWPEDLRVREWPRVVGSNESRVTSNEKGQVR